jgi:hypothetical protein
MTNFEDFNVLFKFLKVENSLLKHRYDSISWTTVEIDVFSMYCGVRTRFLSPHHLFFLKLVDHYNDVLSLVWWTKLVFHIQYVAFKFGPQMYMFH